MDINRFLSGKAVIWRHENPISDLSKESTSSSWSILNESVNRISCWTFCCLACGVWIYKIQNLNSQRLIFFLSTCVWRSRATVTSLFLWHRWFFLPLESAVWQPGLAMFLRYSQYSELHIQVWETSWKLNWTKAVYQRSSLSMVAQVQESILVSKTSIQFCTVEFLPNSGYFIFRVGEKVSAQTYRKVF